MQNICLMRCKSTVVPEEVTRRASNVKNEQRYKPWIKLDITHSLERSLECQVTLYFYPHSIAVIQKIEDNPSLVRNTAITLAQGDLI